MPAILHPVNQGATVTITGTIQDSAGVAIPLTSLTTATLTLYDRQTRAIINSRNAQDILNTNGTTIHATSGLLTCILDPSDNTCTGAKAKEIHVALFRFTYNVGAKAGITEVFLEVAKVPWL